MSTIKIIRAERNDECFSRSVDEALLVWLKLLNILPSLAILIADDHRQNDDSDQNKKNTTECQYDQRQRERWTRAHRCFRGLTIEGRGWHSRRSRLRQQ